VLTLSVSIPLAQYSTPARESAFWDDALARVRALPGVESAGAINQLPASGGGAAQPIAVEGRASATLADQPVLAVRQSTPQYLRAMRIPLQRGRDFEENDVRAVLLSALAAKQLWPNEDPIGKRIRFPLTPSAPWEVVGIVGDAKQTGVSVEERLGTIYQWQHERPWSGLTLAIRTSADPHSLARAVTGAIHQVDSQVPVQDVLSMEERLADSLAPEWLSTWLLGGFAGMALLLAGVGIYSVLAYAVRRQTREIGIRMALGAGLGQVLRMVLLEGMKPALAGVLLGVAGAVSLARVLSTLVYGVSPWDPLTYAAVCVVLAAVAALACVGPAWRASRVDPVVTLREE
jgi:predicted permease